MTARRLSGTSFAQQPSGPALSFLQSGTSCGGLWGLRGRGYRPGCEALQQPVLWLPLLNLRWHFLSSGLRSCPKPFLQFLSRVDHLSHPVFLFLNIQCFFLESISSNFEVHYVSFGDVKMRSVFPIKLIQNMYLKNTFGLNLSFPRMFFQKKKKRMVRSPDELQRPSSQHYL